MPDNVIVAATLHARQVEDIDASTLLSTLEKHGVVAVRGLIAPDTVLDAKQKLRESFSIDNDQPGTGESPDDLFSNFQKFSVNGGEFREKAYPQCVRSFYNPIFAEDLYGMRDAFQSAAGIRNLLMGKPLTWAVASIEDSFWTAARIHHYPAGGGFMGIHSEDYIPRIYEAHGLQNAYYQPLIVMSRKGKSPECDYETGGGYFCQDTGKYYFEEECCLGDVLVYDTRVMHGVTEVDFRKPFRQGALEGRFAAFVTLYRDLSPMQT